MKPLPKKLKILSPVFAGLQFVRHDGKSEKIPLGSGLLAEVHPGDYIAWVEGRAKAHAPIYWLKFQKWEELP